MLTLYHLADSRSLPNMIDATPPPRGAQKFPRATSCKISCPASDPRSPGTAAHSPSQDPSSAETDQGPPYSLRQR
jgi:hypothetical protein